MSDLNELEGLVKTILSKKLSGVEIVDVTIRPDVDDDGDDVLIVKVVFESRKHRLNSAETTGLVRRILPEIRERGVSGFPILSFIAKSELGKTRPEVA